LALHLTENRLGHEDAAWLGQGLDPGCNIDAIAIEIIALDHDIAEIDSDAKHDPAILREIRVCGRHCFLKLERTFHGMDGAGELDNRAIADEFHDPAAIALNDRLQDLAPPRLEDAERAGLVAFHQPAVANYISGKNCGKPSLHSNP